MLNPLTLPPKLILRALDDLNALADAVRRLPEIELKVDGIVRRLEGDLGAIRAGVEPLEKHLIALRREVEPIQQMAAVRQAVQPLEEHMQGLREEIAPIQQLSEVKDAIVPLEAHLVKLREDISPIQQLSDVKEATDNLEPMIEEVVRSIRELVPKLEEIRVSIEPVGDVADNLPKFMRS